MASLYEIVDYGSRPGQVPPPSGFPRASVCGNREPRRARVVVPIRPAGRRREQPFSSLDTGPGKNVAHYWRRELFLPCRKPPDLLKCAFSAPGEGMPVPREAGSSREMIRMLLKNNASRRDDIMCRRNALALRQESEMSP